ncbi:lymphocyte antigen 75-like [Tachypleus tridentatus]|uniref:lymphocyte antigen 75-like n=1 Tax=Tachypleus tridentatus TaxID=6853 RepID=UPI003FD4DE6D
MKRNYILLESSIRLLLVIFLLKLLTQANSTCARDYIYKNGFCYKVATTELLSWSVAAGVCKSDGAQLATIDLSNEEEQIFLQSQLQVSYATDHWIGLRELEKDGNWIFSDSSVLSSDFMLWGDRQPNDPVGLSCARISTKFNLYIGDITCSSTYHAICEKSVNNSQECADWYTAGNHFCYTFRDVNMTYEEAVLSCGKYGSMLAVVKDIHTLEIIQSLIKYRPPGGGLWIQNNETNSLKVLCELYVPGLKVLKTDQCNATKGYICRHLPFFLGKYYYF